MIMEYVRSFRLGIIDLLGITVPGMLILLILSLSLAVPFLAVVSVIGESSDAISVASIWESMSSFYEAAKVLLWLGLILISYIVGYIIRLSTPDYLDKVSAERVVEEWEDDLDHADGESPQEDKWPYQGESDNKFPYFHFRDYLVARGFGENLAKLATWGNQKVAPDVGKRSKTIINMMKLDIAIKKPDLAAIIESNEAHIRLMSGTWIILTKCVPFALVGLATSILSVIGAMSSVKDLAYSPIISIASILVESILLLGMLWSKNQIEISFHYQRVRELTYILGCAYHVYTGGNAFIAPVASLPEFKILRETNRVSRSFKG